MDIIGFISALILAVVLALGGSYLVDRTLPWRRLAYLLALAILGVYGGSELFGELGGIDSLSAQGPSLGGFYPLTGLIGGLLLVGTATLSLRRAVGGQPTDVASVGNIRDPQLAHLLFADVRSAPLWLGVRLYLGYEWLAAGWHKVTDPAWMDGGQALRSYWERAVAIPEGGRPAITYGWYRELLRYMLEAGWYDWFAKLVAVGELLVGLALLAGALVGIAAFFGTVMNFSFMLAGSASSNPVLFGLAVFLVLAWKVAGWWGLDRVLLPALGAPWSPGRLFARPAAGTGHKSPA